MSDNVDIMKIQDLGERLAISQAIYKVVKSQVATKADSGIRSEVDQAMAGLNAATGASKIDLKVRGTKVGTLYVSNSVEFVISDGHAFDDWAIENGYAIEYPVVNLKYMPDEAIRKIASIMNEYYPGSITWHVDLNAPIDKIAEYKDGNVVDKFTGEVIPGVTCHDKTTTRISGCSPEKVADALRGGGDDMIVALLESGE